MKLIQFRNICIYLFLVSFFFFPRLQTLFIGSAFLATFFTGEFSNFKEAVLGNKVGVTLAVYFLLTFASMIYTEDVATGWKGLEIKFSMIAFPLFLPVIFHKSTIDARNKVLNVLAITAFMYALLSFGRAIYLYAALGETINFRSVNLGFRMLQDVPFVHPTYVSMYYVVLIFVLGKRMVDDQSKKHPVYLLLLILFYLVFIFFSSSKAGILLSVLSIFSLLIYFAIKKKKVVQAVFIFLGFIVAGGVGVYNSSLKVRFTKAYEEMTSVNNDPAVRLQSTGTRIWVWKSTLQLIEENPVFGVGVGDIRRDLTNKYKEVGIEDDSILVLDSHEQYLQTAATIGIVGLVSLLSIFLSVFYYSKKHSHFLLFGLGLTYFLFGFTESMFETQAGIIFFTFFSLFWTSKSGLIKSETE